VGNTKTLSHQEVVEELPEKRQFSIYLPIELKVELDVFAAQNRTNTSAVVEQAAREFLEKAKRGPGGTAKPDRH
jgi:metal-responsive CopG/Arc/MetJ family transcriptional regulator